MFHPDTLEGETFEDYERDNLAGGLEGSPETRQCFAGMFFGEIEYDAEVTKEDGRAEVSFYTEFGEALSLAVRLNDDGIWLVERPRF